MGKKQNTKTKVVEDITYSSLDTDRIVSDSLKNKVPVVIHYNNETGDWVYAISLESEPGFWLDAFGTKKAAEGFCKRYKLPVKNYIRDTK